jgi:hypothetical protein
MRSASGRPGTTAVSNGFRRGPLGMSVSRMGWPAALAPSNSLIAWTASRWDSYVTKAVPSERPARSYFMSSLTMGPMRVKRPCYLGEV